MRNTLPVAPVQRFVGPRLSANTEEKKQQKYDHDEHRSQQSCTGHELNGKRALDASVYGNDSVNNVNVDLPRREDNR